MTEDPWSKVDGLESPFGRVCVLDTVDSTQDEARRLADAGEPGVVIAKRQVKGRGRQGRTWLDADGAALSMSLAVRSHLPPTGLSIAIGLGVIHGCTNLGVSNLAIKWPNDVVERSRNGPGRKVAGVLIESANGLAIVGVGVNVHAGGSGFEGRLARAAMSIEDAGVKASRQETALAVLEGIARMIEGDAIDIRESWHAHSTLRGYLCRFRVGDRSVEGTVLELDAQWRLVLQTADGSRLRIDAAFAHFEEVLAERD